MILNIEKSGEQDLERFKEWLVNTDPVVLESILHRANAIDPLFSDHGL